MIVSRLFEHIGDLSSLNKRNHNNDSVRIYVMLTGIDFHNPILRFSRPFSFSSDREKVSNTQEINCFTTFSNTSKLAKNTPLRVVFLTLKTWSLVLDILLETKSHTYN